MKDLLIYLLYVGRINKVQGIGLSEYIHSKLAEESWGMLLLLFSLC